ncbi:hypothetical protein LTR09_012713 [Extremus antarcticus]|uniref:Heterokaryon incompatibility domain-containing protein n=1 Tax=Extremus antarcticus TaxID=702011 RepID=A0AAJ0D9F4_9PEZI|nr:hypothetical protein LTR09_012713 [Extremus antarcticus]
MESRNGVLDSARPLYQPIEKVDTRLLILEPKQTDSRLTAELVTSTIGGCRGALIREKNELQGHIDYTAVSYRWGEDDPEWPIFISGNQILIKKSLYWFMQQYRHNTEKLVLWIDALCINQDDDDEKAVQVSRMLEIYKNAKDVIVWLGEGNEQTRKAIKFIEESSKWSTGGPWLDWSRNTDNEVILGAEDLYNREWIRRIWVVQEVWAARQIVVWCGSSSVSWTAYMGGARHEIGDRDNWQTRTTSDGTFGPQIKLEFQQALQNLWESSQPQLDINIGENLQRTMLQLLLNTTTLGFKEEHDRIYPLLNMAADGMDFDIDYTSPAATVFAKFTKHLMKRSGIHTVLALDGRFGGKVAGHELPSWSLDWRSVTPMEYFESKDMSTIADSFRYYQAVNKLDSDTEPLEHLTLRGCRIAIIGANASESQPRHRLTLSSNEFETEPETGSSTTPRNSRLLVNVPFTYIEPVRNIEDLERTSYKEPYINHTRRLKTLAVPLNVKDGDLVVLVKDSYLPLVMRSVPTVHKDLAGQFQFVGYALAVDQRKEGKKSRHKSGRSILGRFDFLRAYYADEFFTLI